MPTTTIEIPFFNFSAFTYGEVLLALRRYIRTNLPGALVGIPYEPLEQIIRSFALVCHLNNMLLDIVANEHTMKTARLRTSVKDLCEMIDYYLRDDTPAVVDMLCKLNRTFAASTLAIAERSAFATKQLATSRAIQFEADEDHEIARTDRLLSVLAYTVAGAAYTDFTTENNAALTQYTPWPVGPAVGDMLYISHGDVIWNENTIDVTVPGQLITVGHWEYYQGDWKVANPTAVTDLGGGVIRLNINSLLGTVNRAGAVVRVYFNQTDVYEELTSTWDAGSGENRIETVTSLGQGAPISTTITDYSIGALWLPVSTEVDGTLSGGSDWAQDGAVTFDIPRSTTQNWIKATIEGVEGYWLRYRIVALGGAAVSPTIESIGIEDGDLYAVVACTQGVSTTNEEIGISTGLEGQAFTLAAYPYIGGTAQIYVGADEWTETSNFMLAGSNDKVYKVSTDDEGRATISFGDGVNGRVPTLGSAIVGNYRTNATDDGNVAENQIIVNKSAVGYISTVTNPLRASGWRPREGYDRADLEKVKLQATASLRALGRAVTAADCETLAKAWVSEDGASPVARAYAIEEGYGPKTVKLIVVGAGGGTIGADERTELDTYFNGDAAAEENGVLLANTELTSANYTQHVVNVVATVRGGTVSLADLEAAVSALLSPTKTQEDGVTWLWDFGGRVAVSRIEHEIFAQDEDITDVDVALPAADFVLGAEELPVIGTVTITRI